MSNGQVAAQSTVLPFIQVLQLNSYNVATSIAAAQHYVASGAATNDINRVLIELVLRYPDTLNDMDLSIACDIRRSSMQGLRGKLESYGMVWRFGPNRATAPTRRHDKDWEGCGPSMCWQFQPDPAFWLTPAQAAVASQQNVKFYALGYNGTAITTIGPYATRQLRDMVCQRDFNQFQLITALDWSLHGGPRPLPVRSSWNRRRAQPAGGVWNRRRVPP